MMDLLSKKEINGEELKELLHLRNNNKLQFLLVDVREEYEYNVSRINGVDFLIPLSELYDKVKEIENQKELPIVMQCKLAEDLNRRKDN